ncbi:DUF4148 domain-containing protein [Paraburkholderia sp. GAS42]|jgi:hypothetical protein|uniref:DUF4148 domain-containing protein n=2 Tax=unclassified Paraburkholderia TaxID=2615204 RepID=UPI003D190615
MLFEAARNPGANRVIRLASGMSCTMLENMMKTLTLIPIAALALCTTLAYAGDNADTSTTASDSNAAMTSDAVGGTSVSSSGSGAYHGKTRAEVKQELQRAQQDGTLDRLNALYGGQ